MDRSGPMVAACLAPTDLRPEIDDLSGGVRSDLRRADLTAADAAALEHALRTAEAWDGWVLVVATGPAEIEPVLRDAAALGAEVLRIDPGSHPSTALAVGPSPVPASDLVGHPAAVAAALAAAIRSRGTPAAVFCGDRSAGVGVGAVPALLAHELGIDQALGLVSVRVEGAGDGPGAGGAGDGPDAGGAGGAGDAAGANGAGGRRLVAERRLDGGRRQRLIVHGPAVLSVEGAGTRLRRAGLEAALSSFPSSVPSEPAAVDPAGDAELKVGTPRPYRPRTRPVPPPTGSPHERLVALTGALSTREPARVVGPLDPDQAADELLDFLRRSGYID